MKPPQRKRRTSQVATSTEIYFVAVSIFLVSFLICVNNFALSKSSQNAEWLTSSLDYQIPRVVPESAHDNRTHTAVGISDNSNVSEETAVGISENSNVHKTPSSPYAYVWIIGGINEDKLSYRGFIWDILISASLLRRQGSTADFWLYARLSSDSKRETMLDEDVRLLEAMGIRIKYLDKPQRESFAQVVYDKFLTINMTEYKRVMFLDADIIPLTNMDYYFHLSDPDYTDVPTLLKPNFIVVSSYTTSRCFDAFILPMIGCGIRPRNLFHTYVYLVYIYTCVVHNHSSFRVSFRLIGPLSTDIDIDIDVDVDMCVT